MSRSFGGTSLTTRSPMLTVPLRDRLEPGDHPQRGRLAAARRADEHDELLVGDVEVEGAHRLGAVGVHLPHVLEADLSHVAPSRGAPVGPAAAASVARSSTARRARAGAPCSTAGGGVAGQRREEQPGAELAALEQRLADGREPDVGGELDVVEADDRQVLGDAAGPRPRPRRARRWPARRTTRTPRSGGSGWASSSVGQPLGDVAVVGAVAHELGSVTGCPASSSTAR